MKKILETLWTNFKDNITLMLNDFKMIDDYTQDEIQHYNVKDVMCIVAVVCGCCDVILCFLCLHFPLLLLGVILLIISSFYNIKNKQ